MQKRRGGERKATNTLRSKTGGGRRHRPAGATRVDRAKQWVQLVDAERLRTRAASALDWQATAGAWAREAWEKDGGRRNGLYLVHAHERERGYLVIYNNHPHAGFPLLREQELSEIRRRLSAAGVAELAYAIYPHIREGFTYAVVLGVGAGWAARIASLVHDATDECWSRRR